MLKILKYNNKNSFKYLELFLNKRKFIQKEKSFIVSKILRDVKKNGDKAVLRYEKKIFKNKNKFTKSFFF